jgi:hypothetical protein
MTEVFEVGMWNAEVGKEGRWEDEKVRRLNEAKIEYRTAEYRRRVAISDLICISESRIPNSEFNLPSTLNLIPAIFQQPETSI